MEQGCVCVWVNERDGSIDCSRDIQMLQTLLEQSKGIFRKVQGLPPDKITPTVGLNGEWLIEVVAWFNINM